MTALQRRGVALAKVLISAVLMLYLLREIGVSDALRQAERLSLWTALLVVGLLCAYTLVAVLRWLLVLRALGLRAPMRAIARIMFSAAFFSQFLPSSIGVDAVRIWESHRSGLQLSSAVHSVILERAAHFVALAALAAVAATLWSDGRLPRAALLTLWAAFAVSMAVVALLALADKIPLGLLPAALRPRAAELAADSRRVFGNAGRAITLILTVLGGQIILVIAVAFLAHDLAIRVSMLDCLALLPTVVLISSIPVSIAGWGVREYAMVTAFGYADVPAGGALLLSISLALLAVVASLPGAIAWLTRRQRISPD